MKNFYFTHPVSVYFGAGVVNENLPKILSEYGKKVLLCYGKGSVKRTGVLDEIKEILISQGKIVEEFSGIMPNPTYRKVQDGARLAKEFGADLAIALGGGSVIDCCKIICAQAVNDFDIWDGYFKEKKTPENCLPLISIVTVFGTGAEMNSGAVITNEEQKRKACIYGAFSDYSFLELNYFDTVSPLQTMSGSFDTLSHCLESYFAKPDDDNLTDDINLAIMRKVVRSMINLADNPNDRSSKSEIAWASALAENGLLKIGKESAFQAHQIEHQLGAYTDCNHGLGLAVISPAMYKKVYEGGVSKFKRFAIEVFGVENSGEDRDIAYRGIVALENFIKRVGLPTTLREIGVKDKACFKAIADSTNIKTGCFTPLTARDVLEILNEVY